ncbi:MAG: ATP-binding cassette domain-containing protein, partial [Oscillospiraceae bacterium]
MIFVENLSKQFSKTIKLDIKKNKTKKVDFWAVNHINFHVEKGDIFGILGPNGAGKTTLMRMLGGILTPST